MMKNPFELFDLPVNFMIDQEKLNQRYLNLQKNLHPDNFAHSSAQEQRLAMQRSAEINDGLQILKNPILRADAIIAINTGECQNLEETSTKDMAFLMQQMEWRERLAEIEAEKSESELELFITEVNEQRAEILEQLTKSLEQQQWPQAQALNDKLRFIHKLQQEIERIEEQLLEF